MAHKALPFVLIVDDAVHQRKLYQIIADRIGIAVQLAGDAGEALNYIDTMTFELILTDWVMPDLDGLTLASVIRQRLIARGERVPPIVCVTAKALEGDRAHVLQAGLDDYLAKPFSLEQLKEMIDKWLPSACKREHETENR